MSKLDIEKVYIDTRFKSSESTSDTDFYVDLPRSMNIPDDCVCYIDEIVLPVSWTVVDERNNKLYMRFAGGDSADFIYKVIQVPNNNYTGETLASALQVHLNATASSINDWFKFNVTYDFSNNLIAISLHLTDFLHNLRVTFVSDADLITGVNWESPLFKSNINSLNGFLRLNTYTFAMPYSGAHDSTPTPHT